MPMDDGFAAGGFGDDDEEQDDEMEQEPPPIYPPAPVRQPFGVSPAYAERREEKQRAAADAAAEALQQRQRQQSQPQTLLPPGQQTADLADITMQATAQDEIVVPDPDDESGVAALAAYMDAAEAQRQADEARVRQMLPSLSPDHLRALVQQLEQCVL